jgi:glycosyltransferase involved in cell wall biosynthesis
MKLEKLSKTPFVSICTPTFNRRPFFPYIIKCFENQTYPRDKMEWIIIDDGTDKIEDLVAHLPYVKYFKYDTKLTLGKKRNISHEKAKGEVIVYMDDDDYYPPDRVKHAVMMLRQTPKALCAGSSIMHIYFKHINQMYQVGPYGPNHATAATFAFRRELLSITKYEEDACVAEERKFLKDYTIPFVQLDPMKSILVFSHNHNSFDKKMLLQQAPNKFINQSDKKVEDFIKESDILQFFSTEIDQMLDVYEPGKPEYKPDVLQQIAKKTQERLEMQKKIEEQQREYNEKINMLTNNTANTSINKDEVIHSLQNKVQELSNMLNELTNENKLLKDKNTHLENKLREMINEKIAQKRLEKTI